jgi:hypothetical protein
MATLLSKVFGGKSRKAALKCGRRSPPAGSPKRGRRLLLQIEEMEPRLLMSGIKVTGVEVIEAFQGSLATIKQLSQTPVSVIQSKIDPAKIKPIAINQITNTVNSQLPNVLLGPNFNDDFHVESLDLNIPSATDQNSELDAAINPTDQSVQFDFILRGTSGNLSVFVPDLAKITAGAEMGAMGGSALGWGALFGGVAGGIAGELLDNPSYSFTADADASLTLGNPNNGLGNGDPTYLGPTAGPQLQEVNIQANATDALAAFLNPVVSIPGTANGVLDSQTSATISALALLIGQNLQTAAQDGATTVNVKIDKNNGMLEYLALKPLPAGMSLTPNGGSFNLSVNSTNAQGDQFQIGQSDNGGIQVQANGQTANFAPGVISAIDLNPGTGTNSEQVLFLPAGVPANINLAGANTISVGSATTSLASVAGAVSILNPTGASPGATSLTVDDSASTGDRSINVSNSVVTVSDTSVITTVPTTVTYSAPLSALTVNGGSGNDTFQVDSTPAGTQTTLTTGMGTNSVFIGELGTSQQAYQDYTAGWTSLQQSYNLITRHTLADIAGPVNVQANASGQTNLTVDDSGEAGRSVNISSSSVTFSGLPTISYSGISSLNLVAGSENPWIYVDSVPSGVPVTVYNAASWQLWGPAASQVQVIASLPSWDSDIPLPYYAYVPQVINWNLPTPDPLSFVSYGVQPSDPTQAAIWQSSYLTQTGIAPAAYYGVQLSDTTLAAIAQPASFTTVGLNQFAS